MPAPKTILAFPAADAELEPYIVVDDSDFDELTQVHAEVQPVLTPRAKPSSPA